jgi:hypothetical protein
MPSRQLVSRTSLSPDATNETTAQVENGSVSSIGQAAAACNVSRSVGERWLSRGLLPEPP